jgi:hypothetical protein
LRWAASLASELSAGTRSVDQIAQPAMCGRPSLLTAGSRSSVLITALPFASCPVTMRLTSMAMSVLLRCPFARVRINPSDRPCYSSRTAGTALTNNRLIVLIH